MMERISFDDYFMQITRIVAKRSTCLRHHVGAVLVRNGQILTTGYNGAPRGLQHCLDIGCMREKQNILSGTMHEKCRAVHAEQNAIIQAAIHGISTEKATLYCTHMPCILCTKMIINAGIQRVLYEEEYMDNYSLLYFQEAGIPITRHMSQRTYGETPR